MKAIIDSINKCQLNNSEEVVLNKGLKFATTVSKHFAYWRRHSPWTEKAVLRLFQAQSWQVEMEGETEPGES